MLYPLFPMWGVTFWILAILAGIFCVLTHIGCSILSHNRPWFETRRPIWFCLGIFVASLLLFSDLTGRKTVEDTVTVYELFVVGTFPFWALIVAECVFLFVVVSYRWITPGVISLVAFALLLQFFGNVTIFQWMWAHWDWCLYIAVAWVILAAPWAIAKWTMFVRDNAIRYDEILADFLQARERNEWPKDANQFTAEQKVEWKYYFDRNCGADDISEYTRVEFDPQPHNHKADIMGWMVFLPFSFLWTVLNDPIRKLAREAYRLIVGWLQNITTRYWGDKRGHMPTPQEIEAVETRRREADRLERQRVQGVQQ